MRICYIRMCKATMVSDEFVWPQALEKPQAASVLRCWPFFSKGVRQGGGMEVETVQGPTLGSSHSSSSGCACT